MRSFKHIVTGFWVACFFYSCGKGTIVNEFQPVMRHKWDKQTEFLFNVDIRDTSVPYDVFLQLRNNNTYPYQNIWIFYTEERMSAPASAIPPAESVTLPPPVVSDTIEYLLADDFGKWTGNGITLFQNRLLIKQQYHFPDTGRYTISLRHGMRDNPLKGIEDVGLYIRESEK